MLSHVLIAMQLCVIFDWLNELLSISILIDMWSDMIYLLNDSIIYSVIYQMIYRLIYYRIY